MPGQGVGLMRFCAASFLIVLLMAVDAFGAAGIQGQVSWRGEPCAGLDVSAFREITDIAAGRALATSDLTRADGTYRLELPPGNYYLTAREGTGPLRSGELYGYFSGAPVRVAPGTYRNVGFNLIRVPKEERPESSPRSGVHGEITFQDAPLPKAYLYVYQETGKDFKGPAYLIQPVEKGQFRVNLPPGRYWLLARKRLRGGQYGPIETGDYFSYYHGNPVTVTAGQMREARIETVARLSIFEDETAGAPFRGVRGKVVDGGGRAIARVHVFAYRDSAMKGAPDYFSPPTGKDGVFELALPEGGPFFLLAREEYGGPAQEGELYGQLGRGAPLPVRIDGRGPSAEVIIHVAPKGR